MSPISYYSSANRCRRFCSVPHCKRRSGKMFFFPKDDALRERWRLCCNITRKISDTMTICNRHFTDGDFLRSVCGRVRLKNGTIPTEYLGDIMSNTSNQAMKCIVPGCESSKDDGIIFHYFPRNVQRRKIWADVCGLLKIPCRRNCICSIHFSPDDYNMTGSQPTLNPNSCPSIFLQYEFE